MDRYLFLVAFGVATAVIGANLADENSSAATGDARVSVARKASEVALKREADGHFYADVDINGSTVRMLADTGASAIVLGVEDAERVGIDVDQLEFSSAALTANGPAAVAEIEIDEVRVGNIVRRNVRAMVIRGLSGSLLGTTFFRTLSKFTVESDELVLRD